jgi:hypothetical protein
MRNHCFRLLFLAALAAGRLPAQSVAPQAPRGPGATVLLMPVGLEQMIAAARAADDERLAATKAGDPARLDAIFSGDLRYAHSSGKVDTKASYVKSLVSRSTVYESFDYQERNFKVAGPGVVVMSGRVVIHSSNDGQPVVLDLNFLAVWREENGRWRFLAWQSCRNPAPAATSGR